MAFLLINGVIYEAQHDGAGENEPEYVGEMSRAFSGALRSGVRAKKRTWNFTLIPLSQADYATFLTAIGLDVALPVSGDMTGGVSVTSIVRVTASAFIPSGSSFMRVANISIIEV